MVAAVATMARTSFQRADDAAYLGCLGVLANASGSYVLEA
ncbi:hypothetical protein D8I24_5497 (plasmid) [Cupriavidus necator H850]|nr:hypothetical protein D8I24_5497 [Cupriavidus necator H850]